MLTCLHLLSNIPEQSAKCAQQTQTVWCHFQRIGATDFMYQQNQFSWDENEYYNILSFETVYFSFRELIDQYQQLTVTRIDAYSCTVL